MRIRQVINSQWYRVDKSDGRLIAVNGVNVLRAAQGNFTSAQEVIATGRFQTAFAIYSRGEQLTETEKQVEGDTV